MAVQSDAFVFFGATGDLAYKQIFPALQSLTRRGRLDMPVIGVAKSGWTVDQLRERARQSLEEHGGVDEEAFARLSANLRYVDGDYQDPATFQAIRKELGSAQRPAHYLAIPPMLFGVVVEQLAKSGCAKDGRVIIEKPFGHDLASAREVLPSLCGRDPSQLDETEIARAVIESVAENTSDAVVAPLLWGAVGGIPGLVAYRAVNTLDAMVGHRSARYLNFGWASARLDDAANWVPARVTAALTAACAPLVTKARPGKVIDTVRRDGGHHPSPNAGWCEAAFAAALGVRLGGTNVYGGVAEARPGLGEGRAPDPEDIRHAIMLSRAVTGCATALAVLIAVVTGA